jgi:hypothetical protein
MKGNKMGKKLITRKTATTQGKEAAFAGIMPEIKQTRLTKATKFAYADSHTSRQGTHIIDHFVVDWRSLERNKYAPWKRGINSGLPQG